MIFALVFAIPASAATNAARATEGNARLELDFYVRSAEKMITIEINWSDDYFNNSATEKNLDLAIASLILSNAAYDQTRVKNTLAKLGFTNNVKQDDYGMNNWDAAGYTFAGKKIGDTTVIAIVLRGTPTELESLSEWGNNILVRFEYVANNILKKLDTYLAPPGSTQNIKFLITGHSRGAAVANILGQKITDSQYGGQNNQNNVFVYTFASPNTTHASNRASYKNIFNWINDHDDINTGYPPLTYKYGDTVRFAPDSETRGNFTSLTDKNYYSFLSAINPFSNIAHETETYMAYLLTGKTVSTKTDNHGGKVVSIK